jgi:hypothetical protein
MISDTLFEAIEEIFRYLEDKSFGYDAADFQQLLTEMICMMWKLDGSKADKKAAAKFVRKKLAAIKNSHQPDSLKSNK